MPPHLGVNGFLAMVFFGAALLHALITAPQGMAGQLLGLWPRLRVRRAASEQRT